MKNGREIVVDQVEWIQEVWKTRQVPQEWKNNTLVPLHKKKDWKEGKNYRRISLLVIPKKVLALLLQMNAGSNLPNPGHQLAIRSYPESLTKCQRGVCVCLKSMRMCVCEVHTRVCEVMKMIAWRLRGHWKTVIWGDLRS